MTPSTVSPALTHRPELPDRGLGAQVGGRLAAPSGIIHVGGHHGEEAPYYVHHHVRTVVWIEAEPDAFAVLSRNVAQYPGHRCIHALATDRDDEERPFYRHRFAGGAKRGYCSTLSWNTNVVRRDPILSRLETFDVCSMRTVTVSRVLREHGFRPEQFQYLSINVQGAEMMVLRGMQDYLTPIQWIFCEAEPSADASRYAGAPSLSDVTDWLAAHGFHAAWPPVARQQFFYRESP